MCVETVRQVFTTIIYNYVNVYAKARQCTVHLSRYPRG